MDTCNDDDHRHRHRQEEEEEEEEEVTAGKVEAVADGGIDEGNLLKSSKREIVIAISALE